MTQAWPLPCGTPASRAAPESPEREIPAAQWPEAADTACLSEADRNTLWRRSILNRSAVYD